MTKPFSPRELVLRVQAILRRAAQAAGQGAASYGGGTLRIDEQRREVTVRVRTVELNPTEWDPGDAGHRPGPGVLTV